MKHAFETVLFNEVRCIRNRILYTSETGWSCDNMKNAVCPDYKLPTQKSMQFRMQPRCELILNSIRFIWTVHSWSEWFAQVSH